MHHRDSECPSHCHQGFVREYESSGARLMHTFPTIAKACQHHEAYATFLTTNSISPHLTAPWHNRRRFPPCGKRQPIPCPSLNFHRPGSSHTDANIVRAWRLAHGWQAGWLAGRQGGQVGRRARDGPSQGPPNLQSAVQPPACSVQQRAALASHAIEPRTGWNGTPFPGRSEQAPA